MELRKSKVTDIGHQLTKEGLTVDPQKVDVIMNMPPPKHVSGIKRFCGIVTYLAKFLPHLSSICAPLRNLEKNDVACHWEEQHEAALENIKRLILLPQFFDTTTR